MAQQLEPLSYNLKILFKINNGLYIILSEDLVHIYVFANKNKSKFK